MVEIRIMYNNENEKNEWEEITEIVKKALLEHGYRIVKEKYLPNKREPGQRVGCSFQSEGFYRSM